MRLVYVALQDLFFNAKIIATARHTDAEIVSCDSYNDLVERISERKPDLVIVDLNGFLTPAHVSAIRSKNVRVIGYLSHIQTDLRNRFEESCEIMTNSQLSEKLHDLLS
ncbi:MAG TPA: hypothetical protein VJI12_03135 [archaeon]|nr:hypothetical protein [archaeon]